MKSAICPPKLMGTPLMVMSPTTKPLLLGPRKQPARLYLLSHEQSSSNSWGQTVRRDKTGRDQIVDMKPDRVRDRHVSLLPRDAIGLSANVRIAIVRLNAVSSAL
jgi:hypothetical protein